MSLSCAARRGKTDSWHEKATVNSVAAACKQLRGGRAFPKAPGQGFCNRVGSENLHIHGRVLDRFQGQALLLNFQYDSRYTSSAQSDDHSDSDLWTCQ